MPDYRVTLNGGRETRQHFATDEHAIAAAKNYGYSSVKRENVTLEPLWERKPAYYVILSTNPTTGRVNQYCDKHYETRAEADAAVAEFRTRPWREPFHVVTIDPNV